MIIVDEELKEIVKWNSLVHQELIKIRKILEQRSKAY